MPKENTDQDRKKEEEQLSHEDRFWYVYAILFPISYYMSGLCGFFAIFSSPGWIRWGTWAVTLFLFLFAMYSLIMQFILFIRALRQGHKRVIGIIVGIIVAIFFIVQSILSVV